MKEKFFHTFLSILAAVFLSFTLILPCTAQQTKVKVKPKTNTVAKKSTKAKSSTISTSQCVDLGLSVKWAGYNVGASAPEEYGIFVGWADVTGSKTSDNSDDYPNDNPPSDICGNADYDIARAQWGGTWRLPTKAEGEELVDRCTWTWTTYKGTKGYKVTGPNGRAIFLPAAGARRQYNISNRGGEGYYWTGTLNPVNDVLKYAYILHCWRSSFDSGHAVGGGGSRRNGFSVRPVTN